MDNAGPIYLDYHATTPVDPRVARSVYDALLSSFGNPNSVDHIFGEWARTEVERAQHQVAGLLGANPAHVAFTSGASEAIHLALTHAKSARAPRRPLRVLSTPVEHRALLDTLETMARDGAAEIQWIPVDSAARINVAELGEKLATDTPDLVCMMAANNEVGTINPIEVVAQAASKAGAATLIDATQAAGKIRLDVQAWGISYLVISAHKLYGPKGIGALVLGSGIRPSDVKGHGTPNVPGIVGLGESCRLRSAEMHADEPRIAGLRDHLQGALVAEIDGLVVNGDVNQRLSGNLHISIPGVANGPVLARLHDKLAISSGSACSSGAEAPSHVLIAMGLRDTLVDSALRISLGKFTTEDEVIRAAALIIDAVATVRSATGATPAPAGDELRATPRGS